MNVSISEEKQEETQSLSSKSNQEIHVLYKYRKMNV